MDYDADKVRQLIGRRDTTYEGGSFGSIISAIGKGVAKAIPAVVKKVIPAVIPKVIPTVIKGATKVVAPVIRVAPKVTKSITTGATKGVATGATKGATKGFTSAASKKAARASAAKAATKADNAAAAKAVTEIPVAAPVAAPVPTSAWSKIGAVGSIASAVGLPAYFIISGELAAAETKAADARFKVQDAIDRAEAARKEAKADKLTLKYDTDYDADRIQAKKDKLQAELDAAALELQTALQEAADAEAERLRLIDEAVAEAEYLKELALQKEQDAADEEAKLKATEEAIKKALDEYKRNQNPPTYIPPPPTYRPPPPTYVDPYYDPPATYVPPPPRKRKGGMTLRVEDRPGYVDREAMFREMEREFQQRMAQEDEQRRLDESLRNPPPRRVVKGNPIPLIPPTNTYTLGRLPIPKRNRKGRKGGFSMKTLQRDLMSLGYSL